MMKSQRNNNWFRVGKNMADGVQYNFIAFGRKNDKY